MLEYENAICYFDATQITGRMNLRSYNPKALKQPLSTLNFELKYLPQKALAEAVLEQARSFGVNINPNIYIGPEWFCPDGSIAISVPYYLFDKKLGFVHRRHHSDHFTEGYDPVRFKKLFRHELGHAFDHAYGINLRRDFKMIFGDPKKKETKETPSSDFVCNLPSYYGSTHPTEDFAETFAFCITPHALKRRYDKLSSRSKLKVEFVLKMIKDHENTPPISKDRNPQSDFKKLKSNIYAYLKRYS